MTEKEAKAYLNKWYPRLERLRAMGLQVHGFDPGVTCFDMEDRPWSSTVELPAWFLERLERVLIQAYPELGDDDAMRERRKKRLGG